MNILDEKKQMEVLKIGFSNAAKYHNLASCYYDAIREGKYPKSDDLSNNWSYYKSDNRDEFCILREFDEEGFYHLYDELFNPISLFVKKNTDDKYTFHLYVHSIDDSAYSFWFYDRTEKECNDLRLHFMEWLDANKIVVVSELNKECMDLGAIDESY